MILLASKEFKNERKLTYIEEGLKRFPDSFQLYRVAVRLAVRLDKTALVRRYIDMAESSGKISFENIARLRIEAEDYSKADEMMVSGNKIGRRSLQEWTRSLLKRGMIAAALQAGLIEKSSLNTRLERVEAIRKNLVNKGYLSRRAANKLNSPHQLVPILKQIVPNVLKDASSIVMVSSTLRPGGAERQFASTAIGLSKHLPSSKSIKLYCRSLDSSVGADFFLSELNKANICVSELNKNMDSADIGSVLEPKAILELLPDDLQSFSISLFKVLKIERPEVCHLWQDKTALAGIFAALLCGVPHIVLSLRSTRPDSRRRFRSYQNDLYKNLLKAFPDRITIINNSYYGARDYEDWLGLKPGSVGVIHNGFDVQKLQDRANMEVPKDVKAKAGMFCLGWVGRFTFEKKPSHWTETAIALANRYPYFRAMAAGNGPLLAEMQQKVYKAGLSQRITFLGVKDPVEPIIDNMDVLLLTSEREGLPNVLIEAQALGVPVVTVNVGGAYEAVDNNITGLVVDSQDTIQIVDSLCKAVVLLMKDELKRRAMGQSAKKWVSDKFGVDVMVEATLRAYYPETSLTPPSDIVT
jgi:glycosyltransferase involved in cell wall biosynthesis